ncbi:membrane protein insertion efficiency factor YidD [Arsenicicoccus dermatophilus]|uniref:membrane protein insertion efficiency factor YidD n=1 Tax=Arsenicicoccus dermatophilus TaxID=1076331 RepID=UPI0039171B1B
MTGEQPWWQGWRSHPVRALALGLIRFYQLWISPLTPPSCRFYPTCSTYALTAVVRFGPIRGSWLAARRLGRCHPWNPGGVDHVPEADEHGRPRRTP